MIAQPNLQFKKNKSPVRVEKLISAVFMDDISEFQISKINVLIRK